MYYEQAIEKCPNESRFYSNRSAAYLGLGDRSRALSDAEKVIEMNRTWYKGYSRKASVLLRIKKYKDCIETCKIGILQKECVNVQLCPQILIMKLYYKY